MRAGFVCLWAMLGVTASNAIFGLGGRAAEDPIRDWLSSAIYVLVALLVAVRATRATTERWSWAMFALGLSLYALGNVLWSFWIGELRSPPFPSICDALWLSLYPLCYAGVVGVTRLRGRRAMSAGMWLDGIIAGAGLGAVGAAFVLQPVLASATGSAAAVATELAYPICDLLLAALVIGILALRGWRVDRGLGLLGGGFLLLALADCMYAVQVAHGSNDPSPLTNLVYVVAVALLASAAWQEEPPPGRQPEGWSLLLMPAGFLIIALGLLLYDHVVDRLHTLAFALVAVTLGSAVVRMGLAFRDLRGLAEARAEAVTDELTSLPNRRHFVRCVRAAVTAAVSPGNGVSVLLIDLDNFKQLNDTLGHDAGDALLRLIGPRVRGAIPASDVLARLGGDEFAILSTRAGDADAVRVADHVLRALGGRFEVDGLALRITASVGIASFPTAATVEELMRHADIAMYQAKRARSGFEFYSPEQDTNSQARLGLGAAVATALEHDGVVVHFQPQADAATRRITGVEALARLRLPDGRMVPPLDFLGAAEQAGLSRALTRRVLAIGLDQLRDWHAVGHELVLAVNSTVADLLDDTFPHEIVAALDARGLAHDALVIEVTESSILSNPERIERVLTQLKELGVGISLDDFGTGYASLTHLKSLPVRELKLDRSFVAQMCTDSTDAAIVSATVELAHRLGIRVVAEGVEDELTWRTLHELGCERIQGYLLSRPIAAAELTQLLRSRASPVGEPASAPIPA